MNIKIKLMREGASVPQRLTEGSAAYDVVIPEDVVINPGRNKVGLGFGLAITKGYEAKIEARSGFSAKGMEGYALLLNGAVQDNFPIRYDADVIAGKIDSDYRGELQAVIKSFEKTDFILKKGTRIAQLTIYRVQDADFKIVDDLGSTSRGAGGFGHTGTKIQES